MALGEPARRNSEIAKLQNTFFYGILRGQAYVYIIEFTVAVAKIGRCATILPFNLY